MAGITHIKNPLTIIGIFATLAEVMGIGFMPLMDKEVQLIYVWFLMGFPTVLVGAFLWILYKKHSVLYAPSDYREDQTFRDLASSSVYIEVASEKKILEKREDEVKQVEETISASANLELPAFKMEAHGSTISEVPELSLSDLPANDDGSELPNRVFEKSLENLAFSERWAISLLEERRALKFERNVRFKGSNYVFDGLYLGKKGAFVVEVKKTKRGLLKTENIERLFVGPQYIYSVLPELDREFLEFILVFVVDPDNEEDRRRIVSSKNTIMVMSKKFRFKTIVELMDVGELEHRAVDDRYDLLRYSREHRADT